MFIGTGTALVTPFRTDGSLDEAALRRLVRRQIDAGVDFLVPCGTTGESPTLTHEEHLRVVKVTAELAEGKVPVLGGAGGYNTREVIDRKSTRLNSSHGYISYAVFCLKKKKPTATARFFSDV